MNDLVDNMAKRAGFRYIPAEGTGWVGDSNNLELFAELIIRECADIATINAHQYETPGTYVLKHFGLKNKITC